MKYCDSVELRNQKDTSINHVRELAKARSRLPRFSFPLRKCSFLALKKVLHNDETIGSTCTLTATTTPLFTHTQTNKHHDGSYCNDIPSFADSLSRDGPRSNHDGRFARKEYGDWYVFLPYCSNRDSDGCWERIGWSDSPSGRSHRLSRSSLLCISCSTLFLLLVP